MRLVASVCLAASAAVTLGGQAVERPERILSTASRTFVSVEALAADLAQADIVFLNEQAGASDASRIEMALLQALAGRRSDVVFALDVVRRATQEPLEHFQMGHLSDQEFVAESGIAPALATVYLPLMKFAAARTWPIVATGPADPGGEDQMSATIVQAVTIGGADGKRPLLVSLHASSGAGAGEKAAGRVRQQLPRHRVRALRFVVVPSLDQVTVSAATPPNTDYVIYTLKR